jgi:hypothetical protein
MFHREALTVVITDAKKLVGKVCAIGWRSRTGEELRAVSKVHDATYVPLYGGYLITDTEDVRLDRVIEIHVVSEDGTLVPAFSTDCQEAIAA